MDDQYFNVNLIPDLQVWGLPHEQLKAVLRIASDRSIDPAFLMQPIGKECWGNAALVLLAWGPSELEHYIPELLDWIRDLNWPGAKLILELLIQFPLEKLQPFIQQKMKEAALANNDVWRDNLYDLQDQEFRYATIIENHLLRR